MTTYYKHTFYNGSGFQVIAICKNRVMVCQNGEWVSWCNHFYKEPGKEASLIAYGPPFQAFASTSGIMEYGVPQLPEEFKADQDMEEIPPLTVLVLTGLECPDKMDRKETKELCNKFPLLKKMMAKSKRRKKRK
jgi:hypothetical protein